MTRVTSVAIVGLGSRGLSVLERIITLAAKAGPAAGQVRVEIIDPDGSGAGVHGVRQPDYLLLNTTCGQVSMFPDERSVGDAAPAPGPALHEWVTSRGLRMAADGFSVGPHGREIRPEDFLPRRLLGEYLAWFFTLLRRRAPAHVRLAVHRATAVDMWPGADETWMIALSDGARLSVGYAFLTTGYTPNGTPGADALPGGTRYIPGPYPLPDRLAEVAPGESVALGGFGLSAMDMLSCLTVGRGGRFEGEGPDLRYVPSGREPVLLWYSRSGVPCRARPLVVRFEAPYQPLVFTRPAIDAIRAGRGGPLDFGRDILPLILTEMRIAYRRREAGLAGAQTAGRLERDLAGAGGHRRIAAVLDALDVRLGTFDAAAVFDGSAGMRLDDSAAYQRWLAGVLRQDLAEAVRGFAGSPLKAALDILRDLRDMVRYAVDFGSLTSQSLDDFTRRVIPRMNRAVVGPQFERHAELLALMSAGIAAVPFGPDPQITWQPGASRWRIASTRLGAAAVREADWLASARVELPAADTSASPLLRALHRRGLIRRHSPDSRHVRGIDVDREQHPLDAAGTPARTLWALGPLCEGATFYNNLVPSPGVYSRPLADAHRCVAALFAADRVLVEPA
jgi:uncharacterized NAD(P)/FAD-binding protein YdhS